MKKLILLLCLSLGAASMVSAQRAEERKNEIRKGLKEQVMLTDEQIVTVMQLEDEYRPKLRSVRSDSTLNDDAKKAKSKLINDEKKSKIEAAIGKEKADKVVAFYGSLKKPGNEPKKEEKIK